jgi:CBS domain-containing protein
MVDSALSNEQNYPIGIVTDSDFRSKVATGRVPMSHSIEKIISFSGSFCHRKYFGCGSTIGYVKHDVTHLRYARDG